MSYILHATNFSQSDIQPNIDLGPCREIGTRIGLEDVENSIKNSTKEIALTIFMKMDAHKLSANRKNLEKIAEIVIESPHVKKLTIMPISWCVAFVSTEAIAFSTQLRRMKHLEHFEVATGSRGAIEIVNALKELPNLKSAKIVPAYSLNLPKNRRFYHGTFTREEAIRAVENLAKMLTDRPQESN